MLAMFALGTVTLAGGLVNSAYADFQYAKGTTNARTTVGTTTVTVGFQPKALIFYWANGTADGYSAAAMFGYGFSDGTNQAVVAAGSNDNVATSNNGMMTRTDSVISILSAGTPTEDARANVSAIGATDFTLNWSNAATGAYVIHWIALGGTDLTNAKVGNFSRTAATGNLGVTGVGFQPDFVMLLAPEYGDALNATSTGASFNLGFMTATNQASMGWGIHADGQTTTRVNSTGQRTDMALNNMYRGAVDSQASYVSMDANGFTLNWTNAPANTQQVLYLALKGGSYKVGSFNQRTSAGSQAVTGVGFQPGGVMFYSFNNLANTAAITDTNAAKISIGASNVTNEGTIWVDDQDGVTTSNTNKAHVTNKAIRLATRNATTNAEADLSSLDTDGFTLGWTTADATARQILYWAAGPVPCIDPTPSTITIPAGQTKSGSPYNVSGMYSSTGNVGTLQHQVTYKSPGAPAAKTYYMTRDTTTNLGADGTCDVSGTGTYLVADGAGNTTTASAEFGTASRFYPNVAANTDDRALDVYTPVYTSAVDISNISLSTALRGLATSDTVKIELYDYNPAGAAGNGTLVATGVTKTLTSGTTTAQYTWAPTDFTINGTGRVQKDHRLQFRYTWRATATGTPRVYFGIAGTLTSSNFTVTETPAEEICTAWQSGTSIPATAAGGSLCGDYTDGFSYTLQVQGTDPDCGGVVKSATPVNFTWSSCAELGTVSVDALPATISAPTAISATPGGGATGSQVRWNENGGTWSAWQASGAIYTPTNCQAGILNVEARATGNCGTVTSAPAATSYDTTDSGPSGDLATLAVTGPASPVQGVKTVQAQVGIETAPDSLLGVSVDITGTTACNVTNGAMTWNGVTNRWEYSWDTSACATSVTESATITVSGVDPDCSDTVTSAPAVVTVDNTCIDTTSTVSWTPPGATVTSPLVVTAVVTNLGNNPEVSFDDGNTWLPNGSTFTPSVDGQGTETFRVRAFSGCGVRIYGGPYTVTWDGRLPRIRPLWVTAEQAGKTSIKILLRYVSDNNNNAVVTVRYKLTSAPDLPVNWTTVGPVIDGQAGDADNSLNNYVMFMLTELPTDTSYDLELTVADDDGVSTATLPLPWTGTLMLTSWLDSPILHNALRYACSKIGYSDEASCVAAGGTWNLNRKWTGGWGLPKALYSGSQYDGIECSTCHLRNSSNIKRVITTVAPKADGSFPGSAVNFQNAAEGSADFGDDTGGHTTSTRVCQVCHSKTSYHRYDTTGQSNLQHNNKADCVRCHEHNVGFRASCDSCHATPPVSADGLATQPATTGSTVWGEHQKHAVDIGYDCKTCHNGWDGENEMPNSGNLNIGFKASVNPKFAGATASVNGGTYEGRTSGGGYTGDTTTAPATTVNTATGSMTCAVYCHGYGRPVWNPTSSQPCGSCHGKVNSGVGYQSGAPTGINGSKDLSGATTGLQVGKHAVHLDDSVFQTGDPCALCHSGFSYTDLTHVDGTVNIRLRKVAKIDTAGTTGGAGVNAVYNSALGTCTNMECHGDTPWNSTAVLNCTQSCHNYPPVGTTTGLTIYPATFPVSHVTPNGAQYLKDNHKGCKYCHGWNDNGSGSLPITGLTAAELTTFGGDPLEAPRFTTYSASTNPNGQHMDGKITMNDDGDGNSANDADYDPATGGCDNAVCHPNDAAHRLNVTGNTNIEVQADIGPGDCAECHTTGVGGATVVTSASPHTKVTRGGAFTGCTSCHSGHYIKAGGVKIPNNATVGINYAGTQHGGINLGGPGTDASIASKTTEAEICWGCHDLAANAISEWGTNTKQTGSPVLTQYNYGTLSTSNWTAATWTSAKTAFAYKTGPIQSTHAANAAGTSAVAGSAYAYVETKDDVANIRCSYCHDVHDAVGPNGAPYLRGTWWSNPYEEDGAPQSGQAFVNMTEYGAVPRGGTTATNHQKRLGGFWIDANNVRPGTASTTVDGTAYLNPTATGGTGTGGAWTFADSAGLCILCHTNNVNTLDQTTSEALWLGTNGHANAVIGGTGTASGLAANIFELRGGATGNSASPAMHFKGASEPGDSGSYGYRNGSNSQYNYTPSINSVSENTLPYAIELWGAALSYDNTTTNSLYHKFSCSKCHNPHASRLPKLMITNCLDTKHNTWDDTYPLNAQAGVNQNRSLSNWSSAQNCHRVGGIIPANRVIPSTGGTYPEPVDSGAVAAPAGTGTDFQNRGWNTVTPW